MKDLMTDKEGIEPKKTKTPKHPQQRNIIKEKEENTNPLARVFGDMHRLNVFLESRQQSLDTHISQSLHQQHKHTHTHTHTQFTSFTRLGGIKQSLQKKAPPNESNSVQMKSQKAKQIGGKCLNQCWCCWPVLSSSWGSRFLAFVKNLNPVSIPVQAAKPAPKLIKLDFDSNLTN